MTRLVTRLDGPVALAGRPAPSRVLFGPHVTNLGRDRGLSDRHTAYYARRATGGAGVVVTETASVHDSDHPYEYAPLAAACAPGWAAVVGACRPHGTLVLASLGHAGGQGSSAWTLRELWAPSAVPDVVSREVPYAVETPEVDALVAGFAAAAALATGAGCDGVEVEAGQFSLLRQFLSGLTNHRTDRHRDRTLLLREVLTAVRDAIGPGRVLGLRLCCDELAPWAGITPASAAGVVAEVAGWVDYVVPVRGSALSVSATHPDVQVEPGFNTRLCADLRAPFVAPPGHDGSPADGPGGDRAVADRRPAGRPAFVLQGSVVDPGAAQAALDGGVCDLVEMTRAQIADPDLVAHVRAGTPERIRPCTLSNQRAARDPRNPVVGDEAEPRSGWESIDPTVEGHDAVVRDVLVVGGGPAGLEAARTLALRGHRVRLVERSPRLGGALHAAASLPGRARFGLLIAWWEAELRRLGVLVETGTELMSDDVGAARRRGVAVLLATGSRPRPPSFPADVPVLPAAEFEVAVGGPAGVEAVLPPGPVLVHDPVGDWTGVGVAEQLAAAGRAVVLVTPDSVAGHQLGVTGDLAPANARLDRAGVVRELRMRLVGVEDGQAELEHVWTGERHRTPCAAVVDCSARLAEDALWGATTGLQQRSAAATNPAAAARCCNQAAAEDRCCEVPWMSGPLLQSPAPVLRAGDCVAPRTVAEAVREGRRAALEIGAGPAPAPAGSAPVTPTGVGRRSPERRGDRPPGVHDPLRLGPYSLRNRIVFSAHLTGYAGNGLPTARHAAYYGARAAGGAGLVITEEHSVHRHDRPYEKLVHGTDPAVLPGYRAITDAVHAHGAVVLAQLNHNGGQSSGLYSREPVWAPSPLPDPMFREVPQEITVAGIAEVVAGYAEVAARCVAGGFDGVELQCSHASLLRQFLSPLTNVRTDAYGGSLRNRVRAVAEVAAAVREAIGPDRVLGVRICGDEGLPGGTPVAEAAETARLLEPFVDHVNTAVGVATATLHMIEAPMPVRPGYALAVSAAVRAAVRVPVIGVGRFRNLREAGAALASGSCDLVGVVRGQVADPDLASRPDGGNRPCVACNQDCVGRVGLNRPLTCVVNPRAGFEHLPLSPPRRRGRRVLVVGGGPAGLTAAVTAARRGHVVTLLERSGRTGGLVAVAARARGRGELGEITRSLHDECVRAGVEIRTGVTADAEVVLAERPDVAVLATGTRPALPPWADGHPRVVDVSAVLTGEADPRGRVLVVDEPGFHHATSVAETLAARGVTVEIMTPGLVVGQDLGVTLDMELFTRRASAAGIVLTTGRVVTAVSGSPPLVTVLHHTTGTLEHRAVDHVVTTAAGTPDHELWTALRTAGVPVHRAGDCVAPRRAGAAIRDGERVGAAL